MSFSIVRSSAKGLLECLQKFVKVGKCQGNCVTISERESVSGQMNFHVCHKPVRTLMPETLLPMTTRVKYGEWGHFGESKSHKHDDVGNTIVSRYEHALAQLPIHRE